MTLIVGHISRILVAGEKAPATILLIRWDFSIHITNQRAIYDGAIGRKATATAQRQRSNLLPLSLNILCSIRRLFRCSFWDMRKIDAISAIGSIYVMPE